MKFSIYKEQKIEKSLIHLANWILDRLSIKFNKSGTLETHLYLRDSLREKKKYPT